MSKSISANLQTHLEGQTTTVATYLKLTRDDGTVYGFTSLDSTSEYDGVTYEPAAGFVPTGITVSSGLNVDSIDISSILSADQILELDLMAGMFDYCTADLFQMNYKAPEDGVVYLAKGWMSGEVTVEDHQFTMELRSKSQKLQQDIIDVYSPMCNATFGDDRCLLAVNADYIETGVITSVTSNRVFADSSRTETDDHFSYGLFTLIKSEVTGVHWTVPITNPSFETGDLTGWTLLDGTFIVLTEFQWTNRTPSDGTYMIRDNDAYGSILAQETDLINDVGLSADNIAEGIYKFQLYADQTCNHLVDYTGRIKIVFKDALDDIVGEAASDWVAPRAWRTVTVSSKIPPTAVTVSMQLETPAFGMASETTFFDNVKAVVYEVREAHGYQMDVKSYDVATKEFTLFMALPFAVEVGDQYSVQWGCDKLFATCKDRYSNTLNFRGFPHIPNTNSLLGKAQLSNVDTEE